MAKTAFRGRKKGPYPVNIRSTLRPLRVTYSEDSGTVQWLKIKTIEHDEGCRSWQGACR